MNKHLPIYLYGALIILSGVFLLISSSSTFTMIKLTMGITSSVGAILAFLAALSRQRKQVQFAYHEMHALAMLVYGVSVLLFCNTIELLVSFTSFLLVFYVFSEIIFSNWIFNLGYLVVYKIVILRIVLGLLIGLGTVIAMNFPDLVLEIYGGLFIVVGINVLLYVPVMKSVPVEATANTSQS